MDEAPSANQGNQGDPAEHGAAGDRPSLGTPRPSSRDDADSRADAGVRADAGDRADAGRGGSGGEPGPVQAESSTNAESPYIKLPWPLVAGGLAAVLLLALAAGLLANRYLRPSTTPFVPPTSTPIAAAAGTSATQTPRPVAAASTATTAPQNLPLATSTARPLTPTLAPAVVATTPSAVPTVDPSLAAEVSQAYEKYWDVRAQALLALDDAHLTEVASGDGLLSLKRGIDGLKTQQRAVWTSVEHNYRVASAVGDSAEVADTYIDNSQFVDPKAPRPPDGPPQGDPKDRTVRELYQLRKLDGTWKVVDGFKAP